MTQDTLLDAALGFHQLGWSVLPVDIHKKPVVRGWKRYQSEQADADQLTQWFTPGASGGRIEGVAVILGQVSGDLVVRDFDTADGYALWSEKHPELVDVLPTVKTARGHHVYARIAGCRTLKFPDGELRADGAYVVAPPSRHIAGVTYTWLRAPSSVESIPLVDVSVFCEPDPCEPRETRETKPLPAWPVAPDSPAVPECPDVPRTPVILETPVIPEFLGCLVHLGSQELQTQIETAIAQTVPAGVGKRNDGIFRFARRLRSIPELSGCAGISMRDIVRRWHEAALPTIGTRDWDETWADFLHAWERVKQPYGETLDGVIERASKADDPPCALRFDSEKTRLLIRLCRELQRMASGDPFFLSGKVVAGVVGLEIATTYRRLDLLVHEGVLVRIRKGHTGRASEYRYLGG